MGREAVGEKQAVLLQMQVLGQPVPKGRPRVERDRQGRVRTRTPEKSKAYSDLIVLQIRSQLNRASRDDGTKIELPLSGPTQLTLSFHMARPKSLPKKVTHHTKKPDVDNLAKAVMDGLTLAGVFTDDNIVTDLLVRKLYAGPGQERVDIDITSWLETE